MKAIERAIRKEYPAAWILKVHGGGYQNAGVPDLLVVVQGYLTALEVKFQRPGTSLAATLRRVTPRQQYELDALANAGAKSAVVTTVEDALAALAQSP